MAYIDDAEIDNDVVLAMDSRTNFIAAAKVVIWREFEKHKHESYKGNVFGIPYSIKIAKAEPLLEKFLGRNPFR